MVGATATATEIQNNFGRYLNMVIGGKEVIVTKNGKERACGLGSR
ncbi:MAG: type II toxin-antitoxin system Phd/YefM family antitoxin [Oscillospiraceae bacterium]|nr:type II toxin-antitoxin system Phd/YefM family antitoxin [Oscillospiraceae bacterium]